MVPHGECWASCKLEGLDGSTRIIAAAGYGFTECKLDASYYGVAQARKRLFVIGRLGERDGFLTSELVSARSDKQTTLRDLLGEESPPIFLYPRFRLNKAVWYGDEPAPTIIASSLRPIPDNREVRKGTVVPTEAQIGQIQGFPAEWKWLGQTKQDRMQLIANAVPPPLAEVIGRVILEREAGQSIPAVQGNFTRWLMQRGQSNQVARNTKTQVLKAWRLLGGRTFQDARLEILALEEKPEFELLGRKVKSNMRAAVRLYAEFLDSGVQGKKAGKLDLAA